MAQIELLEDEKYERGFTPPPPQHALPPSPIPTPQKRPASSSPLSSPTLSATSLPHIIKKVKLTDSNHNPSSSTGSATAIKSKSKGKGKEKAIDHDDQEEEEEEEIPPPPRRPLFPAAFDFKNNTNPNCINDLVEELMIKEGVSTYVPYPRSGLVVEEEKEDQPTGKNGDAGGDVAMEVDHPVEVEDDEDDEVVALDGPHQPQQPTQPIGLAELRSANQANNAEAGPSGSGSSGGGIDRPSRVRSESMIVVEDERGTPLNAVAEGEEVNSDDFELVITDFRRVNRESGVDKGSIQDRQWTTYEIQTLVKLGLKYGTETGKWNVIKKKMDKRCPQPAKEDGKPNTWSIVLLRHRMVEERTKIILWQEIRNLMAAPIKPPTEEGEYQAITADEMVAKYHKVEVKWTIPMIKLMFRIGENLDDEQWHDAALCLMDEPGWAVEDCNGPTLKTSWNENKEAILTYGIRGLS